jgi:cytoskeleton protein RodZ
MLVGNRGSSKPAPQQPVVAPVEQAARPNEHVPAAGNAVVAEPGERATLRLVFDQESWVEIKDRNGNTIFGQLNPAGSRRSVSGEPPFDLVVGNAPGVRLTYKAETVDLTAHTRVDVARLTLE